jgi:hypothetical protein
MSLFFNHKLLYFQFLPVGARMLTATFKEVQDKLGILPDDLVNYYKHGNKAIIEVELPGKKAEKSDFQKFLISGPVMDDDHFNAFVEYRKRFNQWRLK